MSSICWKPKRQDMDTLLLQEPSGSNPQKREMSVDFNRDFTLLMQLPGSVGKILYLTASSSAVRKELNNHLLLQRLDVWSSEPRSEG